MNSITFFYNHASQWRYEKLTAQEELSPLEDASKFTDHLIGFNVRAERIGWHDTPRVQPSRGYNYSVTYISPASSPTTAKTIPATCSSALKSPRLVRERP